MNYALAILLCAGPGAHAQQKLEFEVASIKPNKSGEHGMRMNMSPGHVTAKNVTAANLIMVAFDVKDFQVTGGPSWLASDHFDLDAKSGEEDADPLKLTPEERKTKGQELQARMRALLADRFHLKFHEDSKEAPAYALVVGKNGPKLKKSEGGSEGRAMMRMGRGQLTATKTTMDRFANQLSNQVGRTVIDKTGLEGEYDIELAWTPDIGGEGAQPVDSEGPTIFTALQEKLGLKLEAFKTPVKVIAIDSIEKPSEN